MDVPRFSRDRWVDLCLGLGCASAGTRFDELERAHSEKHRRYHTTRHIEECLRLFDAVRGLCRFPEEVEYAIWLHDAVYHPRRSDNEEKSAGLAGRWLEECGAEGETIERVRRLILITRHTGDPQTTDERVLVDIDLHILGAPAERFDEYEEQVRSEYRWVPAPLFNRRRAQILEGFLARDPLYHTGACRSEFEESAKANLRRSLARLSR